MKAKPDPEVHAVDTIVQSLRPLDSDAQQRVLQSALALLGLAIAGRAGGYSGIAPDSAETVEAHTGPGSQRKPKGLTQLVLERKPATNSQRIALFAYYRSKVEGIDTFDRRELKSYFAKSRLAPPGNYDRDYNIAVSSGWIHDDGEKSYLTTSGEELVESGFDGAPRSTKPKAKNRRGRAMRRTRKSR